jgi:integrase
MSKLSSTTSRRRLAPRREPYWHREREGGFVGYRKPREGEGTWVARWRDDLGRQHYSALGTILDTESRHAFDEAVRRAREWFDACAAGVDPDIANVADACEGYVAKLKRESGAAKAARAAADFRRLVDADQIAKIELRSLRDRHVEAWRERIAARPVKVGRGKALRDRPRAPATINRDMVPLRAALNLALDRKLVASDLAWRVALRPLKDADRRREVYLDRAERKRLIDAASAELAPLLKALSLLPLRPGALAALTVADFNGRTMSLRVGADKAGAERRITLPPATAAFLAEQARGKTPAAPLIARIDGGRWTKDRWKKAVRTAVTAAGLPGATTAYALRHSTITDLVVGGLPILTVAQISGTSVAMIERFYGHLQQQHAASALAALAV